MRGENILFKSNSTRLPKKSNTGRSSVLIAERNEAICNRYYFYTTFFPFKYEVVIQLVAKDFYLAQYTVIEILSNNNAQIQAIKKEKPTIKDLSKKYFHYNWSVQDINALATSFVA